MIARLGRLVTAAFLVQVTAGYSSCEQGIDPADLANTQVTLREIADVSGVVVDAVTKAPIGGAVVRIEDNEEATDGAGMFYISEVKAGEQTLTITAASYQPFSTTVELEKGANALGTLPLTPSDVELPEAEELRILFVVDNSNSMAVTDPNATRIGAVIDAIQALTVDGDSGPLLPNVRIAIESFSGVIEVYTAGSDGQPGFSNDTEALFSAAMMLDELSPNTAYNRALSAAEWLITHDVGLIAESRRAATLYQVVFLSDGMPFPDNCVGQVNSIPNVVADVEALHASGLALGVWVEFHTVGLFEPNMYSATMFDCIDPTQPAYPGYVGTGLELLLGSMATAGRGLFLGFSAASSLSLESLNLGNDPDFVAGADRDGDGMADGDDSCPWQWASSLVDFDEDGIPDACDPDRDGDETRNVDDNCPWIPNDQADTDHDGIGDTCDCDACDYDQDGIENEFDNCPFMANIDQADADGDQIGDVCEHFGDDYDQDGIEDEFDNCPFMANFDQADADGDQIGDVCDPT